MRVYCALQRVRGGKKNAPLSLYGLKVAHGGAGARTAVAIDDQPVFFADATKKYGRIITSFAVVPFALRVARVVNSTSLPGSYSPPSSSSPCVEQRFSSPLDAGRSRQIFIAPTGLSRAIVQPYTEEGDRATGELQDQSEEVGSSVRSIGDGCRIFLAVKSRRIIDTLRTLERLNAGISMLHCSVGDSVQNPIFRGY